MSVSFGSTVSFWPAIAVQCARKNKSEQHPTKGHEKTTKCYVRGTPQHHSGNKWSGVEGQQVRLKVRHYPLLTHNTRTGN